LPLLISHFLKKFTAEIGKDIRGMAQDAIALLENYSYPGNVRELENTIERAVVLTERDIIQKEDLELYVSAEHEATEFGGYVPTNSEELKEMKRHIRDKSVETIE